MARKKKGPPLLHRASNKMFPVSPVSDGGIKLEIMGEKKACSYLYAASSPENIVNPGNPFIAELTGLDPTYRYARHFIGKSTMFGRVCYQFKILTKPMLLHIRAHFNDYYVLRPDGESVALERIDRSTVDDLIEAQATAKLPNPFASKNLPDTPEIHGALKDSASVATAYNRAMERLVEMRVAGQVGLNEFQEARSALINWYHKHRAQTYSAPPFGPGSELEAQNIVSFAHDMTAKAVPKPIFDSSWDEDDDYNDEPETPMIPSLIGMGTAPPARKKRKKDDYEKRGYIAPLAPSPGRRRINLKDLK
jgi:hypothetical protein